MTEQRLWMKRGIPPPAHRDTGELHVGKPRLLANTSFTPQEPTMSVEKIQCPSAAIVWMNQKNPILNPFLEIIVMMALLTSDNGFCGNSKNT